MQKRTLQQLIGYFLGGLMVLILFPLGIYLLSKTLDDLIHFQLISSFALRWVITIILLAVGAVFAIWSLIIQNIIGQGGPVEVANIEISPKTKNLVVTGPYRYTRNPMLFGTFMVYSAYAILLNSITALLIVCVFITLMLSFVVRSEEKRLLKDFGSQYEEYRKRVSMIIPWFPKR
jgi:protein-S-isoprenylcysteine O-methyltransferase Ste14